MHLLENALILWGNSCSQPFTEEVHYWLEVLDMHQPPYHGTSGWILD